MKLFMTVTVCACLGLALFGCGSSSDGESTPAPAATEAPASATEAPASAQEQAASQVCAARADIQTQVDTLTTLSAGSATKADITSALEAITTDLQKIKDAQADLSSRAQAAGAGRHDGIRDPAEGHRPADRRGAGHDRRQDAGQTKRPRH